MSSSGFKKNAEIKRNKGNTKNKTKTKTKKVRKKANRKGVGL